MLTIEVLMAFLAASALILAVVCAAAMAPDADDHE